jgi:hypothetical protein
MLMSTASADCLLNEPDIRSLHVHPFGLGLPGSLHCTLFHANMKYVISEKKAYRAVSYDVWGEASACQTIFVKNCALMVRQNLWDSDSLDVYGCSCSDQRSLWID